MVKLKSLGFTLIEVLLALAIVSIAFSALLKSMGQDIKATQHIKDKTLSHWVAAQGITMIQLGLIKPSSHQAISEVTTLFKQRWYWRATLQSAPLPTIETITVTVSQKPEGPFTDPLVGYRLVKS